MDRVLDCLDDSFGCADTLDGRSLWLNSFAIDVDFHTRRLWNLGLPDVPGLPANTFQAADPWQIRCGARRREAVISAPVSRTLKRRDT